MRHHAARCSSKSTCPRWGRSRAVAEPHPRAGEHPSQLSPRSTALSRTASSHPGPFRGDRHHHGFRDAEYRPVEQFGSANPVEQSFLPGPSPSGRLRREDRRIAPPTRLSMAWFPDSQSCLRYLAHPRWPVGFVCPSARRGAPGRRRGRGGCVRSVAADFGDRRRSSIRSALPCRPGSRRSGSSLRRGTACQLPNPPSSGSAHDGR